MIQKVNLLKGCCAFLLFACLLSCTPLKPKQSDLFQQLGQQQGISGIVDQLILNIAKDELIRQRFVDVDISLFREHLIEHFCAISGGPCDYTGGEMAEVHRGLNINDAEFNRLVELLRNAMNKESISYKAQNHLLSILARMYYDVTYQ